MDARNVVARTRALVSGSGRYPREAGLISIRTAGPQHSLGRVIFAATLALAVAWATTSAAPSRASAQCMAGAVTCSQVRPDGKGIIGLGLIGAELGLFIPALIQNAAGTNEWWPYLVFPLVGAVAGGIGGWAMEQATQTSPEVDVAFFAIGMGLIVPTVVGTLALTTYQPPEAATEPEPTDDELPPESGDTVEAVQDTSSGSDTGDSSSGESGGATEGGGDTSGGTSSLMQRMRGALAGGRGILRFDGARILLAAPVVYGSATYTDEEVRALQMTSGAVDVNIPLISGTF